MRRKDADKLQLQLPQTTAAATVVAVAFLTLVGGLFVLGIDPGLSIGTGGLPFIAFGVWRILEIRASEGWRPTSGKVIRSQVAEVRERSDLGPERRFFPDISYSYSVGDKEFSGGRVSVVFQEYYASNAEIAEEVVQQFPLGEVTVFHHPSRPGQAVLLRGASWRGLERHLVIVLVGVLITAFGLFTWWMAHGSV